MNRRNSISELWSWGASYSSHCLGSSVAHPQTRLRHHRPRAPRAQTASWSGPAGKCMPGDLVYPPASNGTALLTPSLLRCPKGGPLTSGRELSVRRQRPPLAPRVSSPDVSVIRIIHDRKRLVFSARGFEGKPVQRAKASDLTCPLRELASSTQLPPHTGPASGTRTTSRPCPDVLPSSSGSSRSERSKACTADWRRPRFRSSGSSVR